MILYKRNARYVSNHGWGRQVLKCEIIFVWEKYTNEHNGHYIGGMALF